MSLSKYEVFIKVAELGNLTKAAAELGYTQSGVSHIINGLESEWGFPIFHRKKTGVELTQNGLELMPTVIEILNLDKKLNQVVTSINGLESGKIRIGTFTSASVHWLPGMIKTFLNDFPHIEFELINGDYQEIESWIKKGEIDFGFMTLPASEEFESIPLKKDRMLIILPSDHPLKKLSAFPIDKISSEDFIIPYKGSDYDVNRVFFNYKITPKIKFSAKDDYAIIAMVKNGLGVSILPELVLLGHTDNVVAMEIEGGSDRTLGIALNSLKYSSPATKKFIEHVQSWLNENEITMAASPFLSHK